MIAILFKGMQSLCADYVIRNDIFIEAYVPTDLVELLHERKILIRDEEIGFIITDLLDYVLIGDLPVASIEIGKLNMFEATLGVPPLDTDGVEEYCIMINQERCGYIFDIKHSMWITKKAKCGDLCKPIGIPDTHLRKKFSEMYEILKKFNVYSLRCFKINRMKNIEEWVYFSRDQDQRPHFVCIENGMHCYFLKGRPY